MSDFTKNFMDGWHASISIIGILLGLIAPYAILIAGTLLLLVVITNLVFFIKERFNPHA